MVVCATGLGVGIPVAYVRFVTCYDSVGLGIAVDYVLHDSSSDCGERSCFIV
jgi:hypothetical protein